MDEKDMAVTGHLEELRKRIIVILMSVMVASVLAYSKIIFLIELVVKPLKKYNLELVFFSITEGFIIRFKFAVFVGIVCMSPIILYQFIAFITPGLFKKEKLLLYLGILFLSIFFIMGTAFGYIVLLPYVLDFLISHSRNYMNPIISGNLYLGFIGGFCLVMGIIFLIPLLLLVLGKGGVVSSKNLRKSRKYVIFGVLAMELSFIPSADITTILLVMLPIGIIYEMSIWTIYFFERRKLHNNLSEM